jgi:hypothetical protein
VAKFNGFILTEKGRELLAKGLAGETITFTKMAIGDGTSLTSERERTTLVNQITTLPILNINVKRNGTCEINALLTNKSVTTGFYIKELGIFAHGNDNVEILYAYNISTSPDFVPPFSANNVVEIEYVDTIIVDQVANVTAVIDPSITYITKKYADENYLVSSKLTEILGLEFGGNIQDIGNKTKGKFYYDNVTKFYYECIEDNSLTYNDSGKFRAISNKPISDKVENLFKTEILSMTNLLGYIAGTDTTEWYVNLPSHIKKDKVISVTNINQASWFEYCNLDIDFNCIRVGSKGNASNVPVKNIKVLVAYFT